MTQPENLLSRSVTARRGYCRCCIPIINTAASDAPDGGMIAFGEYDAVMGSHPWGKRQRPAWRNARLQTCRQLLL